MSALPPFAAAWAAQRAHAARALTEVATAELAALSDERALELSEALLDATPTDDLPPTRTTSSGFVEQQRLFARARAAAAARR